MSRQMSTDAIAASPTGIHNIAACPVHGLHGERTSCFAFEHEGRRDCDGTVAQVPMVPVAHLREWIATRREWTTSAGRTPSERSKGHLYVLDMLAHFLDGGA